MKKNSPSCFKFGVSYFCPVCKSVHLIKSGFTDNKKQRYKCKKCGKRFITEYTYNAYQLSINQQISTLTKESVGIRGTARILKISTTTLLKRIILIAEKIPEPTISSNGIYEVDELRSFVLKKNNQIWLAYALERTNRQVVSFAVGARTNQTLNGVLCKLCTAKKIYTDKLRQYKSLIPKRMHRTPLYGTNHIERKNLTIRTHIKRLSRRTICFSKSIFVLGSVVKIYFWG